MLLLSQQPSLEDPTAYCHLLCTDPFFNLHITDRFLIFTDPNDNRATKISLHHMAVVDDCTPQRSPDTTDPVIFFHPTLPIFIAEEKIKNNTGFWSFYLDLPGQTLELRRKYPKLKKTQLTRPFNKNIFLRYMPHIELECCADYK